MSYWLFKTDAEDYTIKDLKQDKKTAWTGVRNYQARNFMRDHMKKGDLVLFYHSGGLTPGVAGIAKVTSTPYPDPTQFEKKSKYFDPKATKEKPIWFLVDIQYVKTFKNFISISIMRNTQELKDMLALRIGNRLSITPVTEKEFNAIENISN
jgi:predicted RNA-binding protein with PUA-like domain